MAEWKKYDETVFTDFGSMGETVPVSSPGGFDSDRTVPVDGASGDFGGSPYAQTIPDDGAATFGEDPTSKNSWGSFTSETVFDDAPFVNKAGDTVRPATGWLVCVEGETKGVDYRLYEGYSYIGRGSENQVSIPDARISSKPSARILYEKISRKFYINECDGNRNPVYLNDALFDGRVELSPYDIISMGSTRLLFVPLCTEKFAWEDVNK